jgi:hypothetical protein
MAVDLAKAFIITKMSSICLMWVSFHVGQAMKLRLVCDRQRDTTCTVRLLRKHVVRVLAFVYHCLDIVQWITDLYRSEPDLCPPYPWGEPKRMVLLCIEDAIRVLWSGDEDPVGWRPSEDDSSASPAAKRGTKRAEPLPNPLPNPVGADQTQPGEKKKRAPQKCKKCGQLRAGHTCTAV